MNERPTGLLRIDVDDVYRTAPERYEIAFSGKPTRRVHFNTLAEVLRNHEGKRHRTEAEDA